MQQPVVAAPGPQVTAINIGGMGMEGHGRKMYRREANHLGKLGMESHGQNKKYGRSFSSEANHLGEFGMGCCVQKKSTV